MIVRRLMVVASLAVALTFPVCAQAPAAATTVIIVRHAEAVPNAGNDPGLSEAGAARANALAAAVKDAGVKAVFTTQYQRTVLTGAPAAALLNVPATARPVQGPLDPYVTALVSDVLARHAGSTVVIVGHSNTVPALVKGFSGVDPGEIAHDSYDNMFIVTASRAGAGSVVRAKYGAR